jgi:hypothetical protein
MGSHLQRSRKLGEVLEVPLDRSAAQPIRHGTGQAQHLRLHFDAQVLKDFPRHNMDLDGCPYWSESCLPVHHSVRRMYTLH